MNQQPRKLTDEDLEPRTKGWPGAMMGEEIKPIELPIYKKSGFKRIAGGTITIIGTILNLLPKYSGIGQAVMVIGGMLGITGLGAGMMKNRKKPEDTKIDTMAILRIIADILIKLFGKKEKQK